ncbi:putative plant lipid transfer protein/Par allergen [Lupinus albus]|uniref:Putative plant lipid transfer protein/Par allergen n=1 Tax=Lupinus albus TaxID=3870 RepID=A0A6A4PCN2_LUPAL|nr:putative plant lipid transfer protein/Par allergen [Lupinus albus]
MGRLHILCTFMVALSLILMLDMDDSTQVLPAAESICDRIFVYFPYCLGFLVGDPNFGTPSTRCCQHIQKLNILAEHRIGPRTICTCIQLMVKGVNPPLDPSKVRDLPHLCYTPLKFPISDSIDCSKVN